MSSSFFFRAAAFALVLASAACGRPFSTVTPNGFVDYSERYSDGEYRAATPDGVVLGIRSFENEGKGTLPFWSRAVELQMRKNGGYALVEQHPVDSRSGVKGQTLSFGHDEGQTPHVYELTLFVTEKKVYVLEAGGPKTEIAKVKPAIDGWVKEFSGN